MFFIQSVKALIVMLVFSVILAETMAKPTSPQQVQEIIVEDLPPLEDDIHIDADSFPLAPDVPQGGRIGGARDYHIR